MHKTSQERSFLGEGQTGSFVCLVNLIDGVGVGSRSQVEAEVVLLRSLHDCLKC